MGRRHEIDGGPPPRRRKILNRKLVDLNAPWVVWAAFDSTGCRILQTVVWQNRAPHHAEMLRILLRKCTVEDLYRSPHANFVLQCIIESGPAFMLEPVLNQLRGGVVALCCHRCPGNTY